MTPNFKFGYLSLRKFVDIRHQIFKAKCTKFNFGWGACGAYSTPPDPLAGFKVPTSKGGEGRGEQR